MNTELLLKVKAAILEEPRRLDIWDWQRREVGDNSPACGTVGCIAGWADILYRTGGDTSPAAIAACEIVVDGVQERARLAVGLTRDQAEWLFHPDGGWPFDLHTLLEYTERGTAEHASVVASAIDRFIDNPEAFSFCDYEDEDEGWA